MPPPSRAGASSPVQRVYLTGQVVDFLRDGIMARRWTKWLPTERQLASTLRVSRATIRGALASLHREGLVEPLRAKGQRIVASASRKSGTTAQSVVLLTPGPLALLSPFACLWLDELRALMHDLGLGLELQEHRQLYARRQPAATLQRLTSRHPGACWVLFMTTPAIQEWFARERVPCVLAGSPHGGLDLPYVDLDFFAACRHAAHRFLQLGHRHLLLLNEASDLRGYQESEAGFRAGVESQPVAGVRLTVRNIRPQDRLQPAQLERIFRATDRPTAMLVAGTGRLLSVYGCLAQLGLRVPQDVSLISRSGVPFQEHLVPLPARYEVRPAEYARRLSRNIANLLHSAPELRSALLMPKFVRGESLASPPMRPA